MNAKVAAKPSWGAACAAALLSACLAAGAQAQPASEKPPANAEARQCFWAPSISGFAAANEKVVNIRVGVKDVYQLEMLGPCPDVNWNTSIGLVTRGSNFICAGMDADIVSQSTLGPQRCPVRSVRKLKPDEVAALGKREKP